MPLRNHNASQASLTGIVVLGGGQDSGIDPIEAGLGNISLPNKVVAGTEGLR